jgi:hypothetical protein
VRSGLTRSPLRFGGRLFPDFRLRDLAGVGEIAAGSRISSSGKFVVSGAVGAYDARHRGVSGILGLQLGGVKRRGKLKCGACPVREEIDGIRTD